MDSNSIKFHVIMVDTENHDIKILDTCYSYQEAAEFMNTYLDSNFEVDNYLKIYYNDKSSVSVFKYFYVYPKQLLYKIHIINYKDLE